MSPFDPWRTWHGTAKDALSTAATLAASLDLHLELPTERALRDWRTEGLLTHTTRRFTGRNLLELLRVKQLRDHSVSAHLIRAALDDRTDDQLVADLTSGQDLTLPLFETPPDDSEANRAVQLLASGILAQFRATSHGTLVGIYADMPLPLRQAQAHLSKLAFDHPAPATPVNYASVHELLHACTTPMHRWAPAPIAEHPDYSDLILIDPDLFTPSPECEQLATQGGHLENLIEVYWHGRFSQTLDRLDEDRRDHMYTLIRQFIAEHPLVTRDELLRLKRNPRVQSAADVGSFIDSIYQPVHTHDAIHRQVPRCAHCHGPIRDGRCRLPSCRAQHPVTQHATPIPMDQAFVAHPALLRYWCDPAQEELRLYRHLRGIHGDATHLYPQRDACDVAVGPDHGVDVKDYADPVQLATKLNAGIGRFRLYQHKYLAVATRRTKDPSYIPRLKERLTPSLRRDLTILSVDDAMQQLSTLKVTHD
ncbi:hypothetical protein [Deinococcus soli (ex Cha et al. 2016)]|uniref:DNA-binding transcriptional MerR regulator n=2 Tax=Deinococcus soli (ex Cha et al. 2016) TaxID=1309411 RepID=A0AAE3XB55_9DEIO|nr:hypothetical protein [Deinococcus soli (ex Cha et al. 2016)]MDR6218232.1 DNA-binding transcriptional MerR regulator [Deinococcus soli (ex Cha et al. 2016)]MDR6328972.1 DNA-binding transcriptional MerR regulator [Deinococcus soli (ex Cha et al. 2016)]MDR6751245.1 DNA-binding transcriptional MerR regulator [Deinococcus soli (ex Cha et al. 2016)]